MRYKIYFWIIILIISLTSVSAINTTVVSGTPSIYSLRITMVNQDPDPAEPGKYVDVRFKIENKGSKNAEDVTLELKSEYPFTVIADSVKSIGSIHGQQIGDIGVIVKFRLKVAEDAAEGENPIKLRYNIEKSDWIELDEFNIDVGLKDAILIVTSIKIDEDMINPGDKATLNINIKNIANSVLNNIRATLDLNNVPFIPVTTTNEQIIEALNANNEAQLQFDLLAEPDAKSDTYKVPLFFEYQDDSGNTYKKNSTIGLIIGDIPDISIVLESSEIYTSGKKGKVIIKFVNKGVTDIKFLNVKLSETEDYKILSASEVYVGNIDSDDYETVDYDLFVKKTSKDSIDLPMEIDYKDAINNNYKKETKLKLKLYSSNEAKNFGLIKGNGYVGIFIVIIILIIGFFLYRKYRKKK